MLALEPRGSSPGSAYDRLVRPGSHVCAVVAGETARRAALVAFVRDGIARGDACVCLVDPAERAWLEAAMVPYGAAGPGLLVEAAGPAWGAGDAAAVLDWLDAEADRARDAGRRALRFAAVPGGAVDPLAVNRLERRLDDWLPGRRVATLCVYDRDHVASACVDRALRTHPFVLIDGHTCVGNVYYEPSGAEVDAGSIEAMVAGLQRLGSRQRRRYAAAGAAAGRAPRGAGRGLARRLRQAFVHAPVGLVHVAMDGRVMLANTAFGRLLGCEPTAVTGRPLEALATPDAGAAVARLLDESTTGPVEVRWRRVDGAVAVSQVSAVRVPEADPPFVLLATGTPVASDPDVPLDMALEAARMVAWEWDLRRDHIRRAAPARARFGGARDGRIGGARAFLAAQVHPDDRARLMAEVLRAIESGTDFDVDLRLTTPDGIRWGRNRGRVVRDADGHATGVTGVLWDVTQLREATDALRLSEERYRTLVAASTEVVWTTDAEGRTHPPQPSWETYTGQTSAEYAGDGWAAAVHPYDRERVRVAWQRAAAEGRPYQEEGRLWHAPSGEYRHVLVRAVCLRDADGRAREWIGTVADIHDRHQAEVAREAVLAVTERARREAEAASRAKDDFLAMLGHELRNPLAAVWNAVTAARLHEGHGRDALALAQRQAEQMRRLVDDLLDVARISRGRLGLRREPVRLGPAVERAVEAARPAVQRRGHRLELLLPAEDVVLSADAGRLEQIIGNLLANAAKYTEPGGRITLRVARDGDELVLAVRDTGIGISGEMLPHVFDLFAQAGRSLDRADGGLGIGLTLVRRLTELHGGRVQAFSDGPGTGAEFVVRLPAVPVGTAHPDAPAPPVRAGRTRVLVVDDNADAAESLRMLLEVLGHDVRVAPDAPAALAVVEDAVFDVMLIDIGLPGIDGYELARRLRARVPPATVLVAVTGFGRDEDRRRARDAGFDHHLVKPVDVGALEGVLGGGRPAG